MFVTSHYKRNLQTRWLGAEFRYLEQAESTNSLLKKVPSSELVHGTVLLTDHQLKGRGQFNRHWISEPFKNLTFTIALKPGDSDRLSLLTLAAAWGIVNGLEEIHEGGFYLKWPNDLMISGKKLGGILTECVFNGSSLDRVLIGIGMNIGQTEFPEELESATSLAVEFGTPVNREEILCKVLKHIEFAYRRWKTHDTELAKDISRIMNGFGKWVRISVNGVTEPRYRKFLGVDERGHLRFLTSELEVVNYTHEQIRIIGNDQKSWKSD